MTDAALPFDHRPTDLQEVARSADLVMLLTLLGACLAALAIGHHYGNLGTAMLASGALLAAGCAAFCLVRGSTAGWLTLTVCNVAAVALHIQLGRGTIEFHFGVFVLLGLLLVYRDWKPILFAAVLFAVHHLAFDRLQAAGVGVYCTPDADFLKTLMHAVYVVVQTGIELSLAMRLRQATIESSELVSIVRSVDRGETLCLDVSHIPTHSPTAGMLKATLGQMAAAMADVSSTAASIETASTEIAAGNLDLSQRTEEQASNLQQTASSMEQLTETVNGTAVTARQASEIAGAASSAAVEGGSAVATVVRTMADIAESAHRIADINAVIDGIAFQTNILALNAAVEAARAGEQGRGFAVVAAEVRSLAQRSTAAAREIKSLIGDSVGKVELGARQVSTAGSSMNNIVQQAQRVRELITTISGAAADQSRSMTEVGEAVTQLDTVTQQNAALVEQGAAAADSLREQARRLNAVVQRFAVAAAPPPAFA